MSFGANQGAAFTFADAPGSGIVPNALFLKASGGTAAQPANYIRVGYDGGSVVVVDDDDQRRLSPTRPGRPSRRRSPAATRSSAIARGTGTVYVYKTSGAVTTIRRQRHDPDRRRRCMDTGTGGGRIGVQLPTGVRVDDFSGGTLP